MKRNIESQIADKLKVIELVLSAQRYLADKQLDKALATLTEALGLDSDNKNSLALRCRIYYEKGQLTEALIDLDRVLNLRVSSQLSTNPDSDKKSCLTLSPDMQESENQALITRSDQNIKIDKLLTTMPFEALKKIFTPSDLVMRADIYWQKNLFNLSLEQVSLAICMKRDNEAAYYVLGKLFLKITAYDSAIEALQTSISIKKTSAVLHTLAQAFHLKAAKNFLEAHKLELEEKQIPSLRDRCRYFFLFKASENHRNEITDEARKVQMQHLVSLQEALGTEPQGFHATPEQLESILEPIMRGAI